jgi:hypothetical protein
MCKVSDQIILCTCKAKSTESLKNYWSLHRFDKTKDMYIIGQPYFPSSFFDPENYKINNQAILSQLNESNIFDTPLLFKPKDKLVIAFGETIFAYVFSKDKWKTREYDYFELENEHNEIGFGKIKKKK